MRLSIIIPIFNEEQTLSRVLDRIQAVVLPNGVEKEVILVNDGSTDQTRPILDQYAANPLFKVHHFQKNQGKTAALRHGISQAGGNILLIQDADLEYSPEDHPRLIEPILLKQAQVVYGSRFKGNITGMTAINRLANIFSNVTFNALYKTQLTDINTCFKVFDRAILDGITIESDHFVFETEITAKLVRRGIEITEIPIDYTARSEQDGKKINWAKALRMYRGMFTYRK